MKNNLKISVTDLRSFLLWDWLRCSARSWAVNLRARVPSRSWWAASERRSCIEQKQIIIFWFNFYLRFQGTGELIIFRFQVSSFHSNTLSFEYLYKKLHFYLSRRFILWIWVVTPRSSLEGLSLTYCETILVKHLKNLNSKIIVDSIMLKQFKISLVSLPDKFDDVWMVVLFENSSLLKKLLLLFFRQRDFASFHGHVNSRMALLQKYNLWIRNRNVSPMFIKVKQISISREYIPSKLIMFMHKIWKSIKFCQWNKHILS